MNVFILFYVKSLILVFLLNIRYHNMYCSFGVDQYFIIVSAEKTVLHKYVVQSGRSISEIVGRSILTSSQNAFHCLLLKLFLKIQFEKLNIFGQNNSDMC